MIQRRGVSILETLVVLAIVGLMLGLLFPAIQATRTKALEMVCKNNLRQVGLSVAQYIEANKKLPNRVKSGLVGGWTVEVLPFLEEQNLRVRIPVGIPITAAPDFLLRQPRIMVCPSRAAFDIPKPAEMEHASYVLCPGGPGGRDSYRIIDAPLEVQSPWASGPEMAMAEVTRQTGPHNGGFFTSAGLLDGVSHIPR